MTAYQVIALDLDGTLLDDQKRILPESLEALAAARQANIKIILATGRHHTAVRPYYLAIDPQTPLICCNGAYLYDYQQQQIIKGDALDKAQVKKLLTLAKQHDMQELVFYTDQAIIYEKFSMNISRTQIAVNHFPDDMQPVIRQTSSLWQSVDEINAIWKVIITHTDPEKLRAFGSLLQQTLPINSDWLSENTLEIVQFGNSKGQRLEEWLNSYSIPLSDVVAFGDNYNDISMLSRVGLSVAMANSAKEIQQLADRVTTTNQQPGIAETIYQCILNNRQA